jgi:minor extracellular serine protease Vpr
MPFPRRVRRVVAALALLAAFGAAPAAPAGDDTSAVSAGANRLWFVELRADREAFHAAARAAGVELRERFAYDDLWTGLSIETSAADAAALARLPDVSAVYPVEPLSLAPTEVLDPELATALAMTGVDAVQSELGFTGAGVRVGLIDSGVDYHHADLGGCFGAGCRVATGWDFVGDTYNASDPSAPINRVPAPDADPDDCNGHGTHVAGIVGANGSVTGVAPGVTFSAYRIVGCAGNTTEDVFLAALERAYRDGARVINISLSGALQAWPQYPTSVAVSRLVAKGIVVVAAAGNAGAAGLYALGAPAAGEKVIAVGAFDNSHFNARTFVVTPGGRRVPYLSVPDAAPPPATGTSEPIVHVGRGCPAGSITPTSPADGYLADPAGKVALIERGACTFGAKYQRAAAAGAAGVIFYAAANAPGLFVAGGLVDRGVFAAGIARADGLALAALPQPVVASWESGVVQVPNPTGGVISPFSSFGAAADLSVKPDLAAPGGLVRSTYPLEKGGYATINGTSMAAPHVTGAAALLLQARPGTRAEDVRTLFQNSADPRNRTPNAADGLDNVHRQGAGMLDVDDAIRAAAVVEPSSVALGEGAGGTTTRRIDNRSDQSLEYDLSHVPAAATGPSTFSVSFATLPAAVTFSPMSVTVPAGGRATVEVAVAANPALAERSLYGGYFVFTPRDGGQLYRVPYLGFKGDYQAIPVLTVAPRLGKLVGTTVVPQPTGATYTLVGADVPYVDVHLDHQARRLEARILEAGSGQPVHPVFGNAFEQEYLPRASSPTAMTRFTWDGTRGTDVLRFLPEAARRVVRGKFKEHRWPVPDGTYRLELRVLKALGDASNPAHWETWLSPPVTLDRP